MSNHLQYYRGWESVPVPAERRNIVDVTDEAMRRPPSDDVIDLRDDVADDFSGESVDAEPGALDEAWARLARAVQSTLAVKESTKRGAGAVPLGMYFDLRG